LNSTSPVPRFPQSLLSLILAPSLSPKPSLADPQSPLPPRTILLLRSTIPGEFFNNDTTLDHKLDERLLNVLNKGLAPPEAEEEKGGKGEGQRGKEGHLFEKDETLSLSPSLSHKERPYFSPWTPIQAATTGAAPIDEKRAARSVG
jgi:hypothetical protein